MPTCIPLQSFYLIGFERKNWQQKPIPDNIRNPTLYAQVANLVFTNFVKCDQLAIGFFRPFLLVVSNDLSVHAISKYEAKLPPSLKLVFKYWPISVQYWPEFVKNDNRMIKIYSKEGQAKMNPLRDAQNYE